MWENLVTEQPDSQFYRSNVVQTLIELSAALIPLKGRENEAASINRRARELIESANANSLPSAAQLHQLSLTLQNRAEIHKLLGQMDEGIEDLEHVIEIEARLAEEKPQSLSHTVSLANAHSTLGQYHADRASDLIEALQSYSEAIQLRETLAREHPDLIDQCIRLASDLNSLSALQWKFKQLDAAYESLDRCLKISERITESYPNLISFRETLGACYNAMSDLLRQRSENAEALVFARKANTLFKSLMTQDPNNANCVLGLAQSHNLIGRLLKEDGQFLEAIRSFGRAVDLYESLPQIDASNSLNLACSLALCIPLIGMSDGLPGSSGSPQELSGVDRQRRKIYGDRAIEALRNAAKSGSLDIEMLESNPDFNSLRARADFRLFIHEIDEKRPNTENQTERDVSSDSRISQACAAVRSIKL